MPSRKACRPRSNWLVSAANPDGRHRRPPRVLAGWQAWIGRLLVQRGQ
jgi:hypothetical protein